MRRLILAASALAVPLTLTLTACSDEPPPLRIESAKPSADRLDARPPQGGSLPIAQWPDACKILTDKEIRAILPQATGFERTPVKVTIMNFDPLSESDPGTTGDVRAGGCEYKFGLPAEYESERNSSVKVVFTAIADPSLVREDYGKNLAQAREDGRKFKTQEFRDLGDSLGPEGCHVSSNTINCFQGPYEFDVGGHSTADGLGEYPKSDRNWTDKVLIHVVRTLSARMP